MIHLHSSSFCTAPLGRRVPSDLSPMDRVNAPVDLSLFQCELCHQLAIEPCLLPCLHLYCLACARSLKKEVLVLVAEEDDAAQCLVSNCGAGFRLTVARPFREAEPWGWRCVSQLPCSCPFPLCVWIGPYGELTVHALGCIAAVVPCPDCSQPQQRGDLVKHRADHCPERPWTCVACHATVAVSASMHHAQTTCEMAPVECGAVWEAPTDTESSNSSDSSDAEDGKKAAAAKPKKRRSHRPRPAAVKCADVVRRKDLTAHRQHDCIAIPHPCPDGCGRMIPRGPAQLKAHVRRHWPSHYHRLVLRNERLERRVLRLQRRLASAPPPPPPVAAEKNKKRHFQKEKGEGKEEKKEKRRFQKDEGKEEKKEKITGKVPCPDCGRMYHIATMAMHRASHSGEFVCDECGLHFGQSTSLQRHVKTHYHGFVSLSFPFCISHARLYGSAKRPKVPCPSPGCPQSISGLKYVFFLSLCFSQLCFGAA